MFAVLSNLQFYFKNSYDYIDKIFTYISNDKFLEFYINFNWVF